MGREWRARLWWGIYALRVSGSSAGSADTRCRYALSRTPSPARIRTSTATEPWIESSDALMVPAVWYHPDVVRQIRADVRRHSHVERAGLLVGGRHGDAISVMGAVVGAPQVGLDNGCHLVGSDTARSASGEAVAWCPNLDLVGVWHSHPGSCPMHSTADDLSLVRLAVDNERGMLSLVVSREDTSIAATWWSHGLGCIRLEHYGVPAWAAGNAGGVGSARRNARLFTRAP